MVALLLKRILPVAIAAIFVAIVESFSWGCYSDTSTMKVVPLLGRRLSILSSKSPPIAAGLSGWQTMATPNQRRRKTLWAFRRHDQLPLGPLQAAGRCLRSVIHSTTSTTSTCLFGTKAGSGIPGEVLLENDQLALPNVDLDRLRDTVAKIQAMIGYETYDISLSLIDDDEMKNVNNETRGVNAPTDILSFPFHEALKPGLIREPDFDIPDYYTLGDLLIDVPYVMRGCQEDEPSSTVNVDDYDDEDDEEDDDRGVSGAMANVYDPEKRLHMLLVHGILHLVGYDHEEDDDYEAMVTKEEEILTALKLIP